MKTVLSIFASAAIPAVLCIASDAAKTGDVTFALREDNTSEEKSVNLLVNVENPKSPITGNEIAAVAEGVEVETASMSIADSLASFACIASCLSCNHDTYVRPEIASKLDTLAMHCIACGAEIEAVYDADLLATAEEDDDSSEDDVVDALNEDDEDTSEDDDSGDDEEDAGDDDSTSDEDSTEDAAEDDTTDGEDSAEGDEAAEDEATDDEEVDDTEDDTTSDEDTTEEEEDDDAGASDESAVTRVLPALAVANAVDQKIRFAATTDVARIEAFLGDTHIGHLNRDEANDALRSKFDKVDLVRAAFSSTFWKNHAEIASGNVESLKEFGFNPASVTIALDQVTQTLVNDAQNDANSKADEAVKSAEEAVLATIKIAASGINKGMLPGTNLFGEVAKMLVRYGEAAPEEAAQRFTEEFASAFFADVVTAAEKLRSESPDYVRGLATSFETASYRMPQGLTKKESANAALSTSALAPRGENTTRTKQPPAPQKTEVETAAAQKQSRYRNVFRRMG